MHVSVAFMLRDMQTQLTSIPLKSKGYGQGHLLTFATDQLVRIHVVWITFSLKQLGLVAVQTIILALLPYVYKRSKTISHCSLSAQGIEQDLIVLLFITVQSLRQVILQNQKNYHLFSLTLFQIFEGFPSSSGYNGQLIFYITISYIT